MDEALCQKRDQAGSFEQVALRSSGSGVDVLTQWGFKAEFGAELAVKEAQALPLPLAVAEPADACEPLSVEADWQGALSLPILCALPSYRCCFVL